MIVGAVISVGGVLVKQISSDWLADPASYNTLKGILTYIRDINGQEYWGISMDFQQYLMLGSHCF